MSDKTKTKMDVNTGCYDAYGYRAAKRMRKVGMRARSGTQDYHMRYDREPLIDMSRKMDRDNWLHEGSVNRAVEFILGPTGFTLQPRTDIDGVNEKIREELWPEVEESPELRRMFNFEECERINLRECINAGDTLWAKLGADDPDAGRAQHIEAERIASTSSGKDGERIEQGVVLNNRGQLRGWKVAEVGKTGHVKRTETTEVSARNGIFCTNPFKRSSQSRGMPVLISGMPLAHRLDDILTAEAIGWQTSARFPIAVHREAGTDMEASVTGDNSDERTGASDDDLDRHISEVGTAIFFEGLPGEKLESLKQNRPSRSLKDSVRLFVRLYCVPLGFPPELTLFDYADFNYSNFRGALLSAYVNFRKWQRHLINRFYTPFYRWHVGRWVANGDLAWRPSLLNHTWEVPNWPRIDEDKALKAAAQQIDRCIASQTSVMSIFDQDRGKVLDEREAELIDVAERARRVEEKTDSLWTAEEIKKHLAGFVQGKTEAARKVDDVKNVVNDDEEEESNDNSE